MLEARKYKVAAINITKVGCKLDDNTDMWVGVYEFKYPPQGEKKKDYTLNDHTLTSK